MMARRSGVAQMEHDCMTVMQYSAKSTHNLWAQASLTDGNAVKSFCETAGNRCGILVHCVYGIRFSDTADEIFEGRGARREENLPAVFIHADCGNFEF